MIKLTVRYKPNSPLVPPEGHAREQAVRQLRLKLMKFYGENFTCAGQPDQFVDFVQCQRHSYIGLSSLMMEIEVEGTLVAGKEYKDEVKDLKDRLLIPLTAWLNDLREIPRIAKVAYDEIVQDPYKMPLLVRVLGTGSISV